MKSIVKKAREIVTQLYERNMVAWNDLDREVVFAIQALIAEVQRMEALAQPEQEPVAWEQFYPDIGKPKFVAQPEQEPVGKFAKFTDGIWREVTDGSAGVLLYTTPPQRTWAGLTDDEVYKIAFTLEGEHWKKIANAIEAKLKEKNT